jgi:hypothetical protein
LSGKSLDRTLAVARPNPAPALRARHIGTTEITQGNIDNNHIYLRSFFEKFPADAIGGSNRASAAQREIAVDWGGATVVMTDLDGQKKFFRKRGWIREFFERQGARAGDCGDGRGSGTLQLSCGASAAYFIGMDGRPSDPGPIQNPTALFWAIR